MTLARQAFDRKAWTDAHARLRVADAAGELDVEDLERLAVVAHMVGDDAECDRAWERGHREWLRRGDLARAVRCAFFLGMNLFEHGEPALGGGWLARAGRLLEEHELDCVEHGYLHIPVARRCRHLGDIAGATTHLTHAAEIGVRFGDADLTAIARAGLAECRIVGGDLAGGLALLDEVLVAVRSGEISAVPSGIVYCGSINLCQAVFDLGRAREWTAALDEWSRPQQGLVPFRGQCLVHRSELMALRGEWAEAIAEARQAQQLLSTPRPHPVLGMAWYQLAELYRLCGQFEQAEEAYRSASRCGRDPQPGMALLRLAQGRVEAACTAICRVLDEARGAAQRSGLLAAHTEITLAAGDLTAARGSADELARCAEVLDTPLVYAVAGQAAGAVLLAGGDARGACEPLQQSWRLWQQLEVPYASARVQVLLGTAFAELGDRDGAELQFDAAAAVFRRLGAAADLARLPVPVVEPPAGGLTEREAEVLALAAEGRTNREIAAQLVLSEHTVRRHLQNVFAKLGVSSRTAATRVWLSSRTQRSVPRAR